MAPVMDGEAGAAVGANLGALGRVSSGTSGLLCPRLLCPPGTSQVTAPCELGKLMSNSGNQPHQVYSYFHNYLDPLCRNIATYSAFFEFRYYCVVPFIGFNHIAEMLAPCMKFNQLFSDFIRKAPEPSYLRLVDCRVSKIDEAKNFYRQSLFSGNFFAESLICVFERIIKGYQLGSDLQRYCLCFPFFSTFLKPKIEAIGDERAQRKASKGGQYRQPVEQKSTKCHSFSRVGELARSHPETLPPAAPSRLGGSESHRRVA